MGIDLRGPTVVVLAGPNGAGKSTFYEAHFLVSGLRFVNADVIAKELGIGGYEAADVAEQLRRDLLARKESFVFETVLSDPHGSKVEFLYRVAESGYRVLCFFIGLDSPSSSRERVALRVLQGGHGVPKDKLVARYERTLDNLARALKVLPEVWIYDNSDLAQPYRFVAKYEHGVQARRGNQFPGWFNAVATRLEV